MLSSLRLYFVAPTTFFFQMFSSHALKICTTPAKFVFSSQLDIWLTSLLWPPCCWWRNDPIYLLKIFFLISFYYDDIASWSFSISFRNVSFDDMRVVRGPLIISSSLGLNKKRNARPSGGQGCLYASGVSFLFLFSSLRAGSLFCCLFTT